MLRVSILAAVTLVVVGCSQTPDLNDKEDSSQSIAARSSNQLVHVEGKFNSLQLTGKRHQSYIFTFQIQQKLHGPWQESTPLDELVRFELYNDFGGRDLFTELVGDGPPGGASYADAVLPVTNSKTYQLVLWRFPAKGVYTGGPQIDAHIVGSPVPMRE